MDSRPRLGKKKKKYDYVPLEQQVDILEDCEHNELLKEMYSLIKRLNKVDKMKLYMVLQYYPQKIRLCCN